MDSLELKELMDGDRELLKTSLTMYHSAKDDTSKINALSSICENMIHEDWVKFQYAQHQLIKRCLKKHKTGPVKMKLLNDLAKCYNNLGIIQGDNDLFEEERAFYFKSLNIYEQINDQLGIADIYNNLGYSYRSSGEITKALEYYLKSLKIARKIGDKSSVALCLNNIGNIVSSQGDVKKGLAYFHKSLKLHEELNDKNGMAMAYVNIGIIMGKQGDESLELDYYNKGLKLQLEIGNKSGIADAYHNIGTYYGDNKEYNKSFEYFEKAYNLNKEIGNVTGQANALSNVAVIHYNLNDNEKALINIKKALDLREKYNINEGLANNHIVYSKIYVTANNLTLAEYHAKKGLKEAQLLGYPRKISVASEILSTIYERQGKLEGSLQMYKLSVIMRDSIDNIENLKSAAIQEANYIFQKEIELRKAKHEKQLAIKQEQQEKQRIVIYASIFGLVLVVVFLMFVMNRLKVTRKQKDIIETQKDEVEEQKQEIMDSIVYAKRIQSAILPSNKLVKECLSESFVLYKPKDVVAGDFYWMEQKDNKVLFAAADCTGHGVPGAMVSVVCNNGLNRSVREYGLTDPGQILDKTREIVIQEFEKSEEEVKDGMDIALCSIEGNKLQYAGAHNPLWIIRNGELIETKANKQPIGQFDNPEPYTTHSFDLVQGDSIYVFSDGYVDQFGGEKGKKFKSKAFRELLLSIQDKSMEEQKIVLDDAFENWKGDLEQIDDVCLIGVRV